MYFTLPGGQPSWALVLLSEVALLSCAGKIQQREKCDSASSVMNVLVSLKDPRTNKVSAQTSFSALSRSKLRAPQLRAVPTPSPPIIDLPVLSTELSHLTEVLKSLLTQFMNHDIVGRLPHRGIEIKRRASANSSAAVLNDSGSTSRLFLW